MKCMNCGSKKDVVDFVAENEKLILCVDCRVKLVNGELGKVGRNALGNESEWSNYACLGYAIAGAKKIGMSDDKINDLVKAIYGEFDMKSVPEAEDIYRESDY